VLQVQEQWFLCSPWRDPTGAGVSLQPMEVPMLEWVYPEGLQPREGIHPGAGQKREEAGGTERSCCGLTAAPPFPIPWCHSEGRL